MGVCVKSKASCRWLRCKKVGIQIGTIDEDEIASWVVEIYKFEDLDSTVKFLLDKGTDAVVMSSGSALQYINQCPGEIKTVGDLISDIPYDIAVCDILLIRVYSTRSMKHWVK